jgi:hypothetical protein
VVDRLAGKEFFAGMIEMKDSLGTYQQIIGNMTLANL